MGIDEGCIVPRWGAPFAAQGKTVARARTCSWVRTAGVRVARGVNRVLVQRFR